MALITSRMSVVRGCPPGLAGGMSGSRMAHSFSVRSTSVAESFHCSTSSHFPLVLLFYYTTFHTASKRFSLIRSGLAQPQPRCAIRGIYQATRHRDFTHNLTRSCWRIHLFATAREAGAKAAKRERRVCSSGCPWLQANNRARLRAQAIIRCCKCVFASPM